MEETRKLLDEAREALDGLEETMTRPVREDDYDEGVKEFYADLELAKARLIEIARAF